jgi:hypothetical protein
MTHTAVVSPACRRPFDDPRGPATVTVSGDNYFVRFAIHLHHMPSVLMHQDGLALPISMELAVPVLAVGTVVCLLVAYDAYRTYRPSTSDAGGEQ